MRIVKISFLVLLPAMLAQAAEIRLGIIGTDTSHAVAFTRILNDQTSPDYVPGARVVAAYKGGSKDIPSSFERVDKYAQELRTRWKIDLTPDIPSLLRKVDAVLLESVDGRTHLEQAKLVIAAGKPVFIDKPLASTLEDAREIARLAKEAGVPWFSSSALRFGEIVTGLQSSDTMGASTWGPGPIEEHHHLDLTWYAIHAIEMLYALMGQGCEEVTRISTDGADMMVGKWRGGRIGTVRAIRPESDYGAVVYRRKEIVQSKPRTPFSYRPLLVEIVKFFETKQPPVSNAETLEMWAFMDAAQRSKAAGGAPTKLR